ncbi:sigma-54-dependent Fis family transcriptional regulator [Nocardia mikamii]|uniref:sigma-54-dependent Fis family transcriptional regulator n=1 Tax=Nocardia mikamii TaxID=508464 RepID=UPI0014305FFD|nr:helix-turn-helix domain-containing protein [Nocardia mikamii]
MAALDPNQRKDARFEQIRRVRDAFLSTGTAATADMQAAGITPQVLESWRRSVRYGLAPRGIRPVRVGDIDLDTQLTRTVDAVLAQRDAALDQSMCGLTLTDSEGTVIRQWVRDQKLRQWLGRYDISPAFSVDETVIGTSSGICLLSGRPTLVRGPEHFSEDYAEVTSAGVPVVHPVTHRVVGSLNLTCRYEDTSPVLLSWVMELVRDIQRTFQESATRCERTLLNAYLTENRDARHPLVVLNEQTIITNATAARLLTSVDQARLWEHASRSIQERRQEAERLVLTNGTVVSVDCREIGDGGERVGALLKIRPVVERAATRATSTVHSGPDLGSLVGKGPRWRELCRQAGRLGADPVLITGEKGTGKLAVAKAIAGNGPVAVLDSADAAINGTQAWLRQLENRLRGATPSALIIRRCDELDATTSTAAANLIRAHQGVSVRVLATANSSAVSGIDPLLAEFTAVLPVPALRERLEDLPSLLDALTKASFERLGRAPRAIRWMPDAVQTLSRLPWPGNIVSLEAVVLEVLRDNGNGYINAGDLPVDVVAKASRRQLLGLEQVEATAIIAALREAGGNKNRAADALGIARSTLYRKMRALGIDLSTMAF